MRWHDLLFLHWPVDAALLRPHIPEGLTLDTFDGTAWLGVVPFRMSGIRPRLTPALPVLSAFPELNIRTYVTAGDKAGVWFFSLDVTSRLAVLIARSAFHLPYYRARMDMQQEGGQIRYSSKRIDGETTAEFEATYQGRGRVFHSEPGSIDAWLTERYCLYSADRKGRVFRGEIHHAPWSLQHADFEVTKNTLADGLGIQTDSAKPLVHFSRDLEVVAWTLRSID
ncbi:MAG: hypothetical protein ACI8Y8_004399 [Planctomycetota bacterium]|jgi:uncharacterized protein YqjF (DUF2071 family)